MEEVDVVIIGAGAVGLALARRLAEDHRLTVVVLERHGRHGMETSSRNSEVIHAGLYYPTGSLKARLCVEGRRLLYDLCRRRDIFCRKTGKMIVAGSGAETEKLEKLRLQGIANGVENLRMLDRAEITAAAGAVSAQAALWSGETGIIDSEELMGYYRGQAQDNGAFFLWSSELQEAQRERGGYRLLLKGSGEEIRARCVVNSAGLYSDRLAQLAGIDIDKAGYRLHWFKGEYFSLRNKLDILPLVYPLPVAHGLGIHLTVDRQGRHRLGPNSFPVQFSQTPDYAVDPSHADSFWQAASRYLPGLRRQDLVPGTAGIRPKLSPDGTFRDFVIAEESARGLPGWVNLIGIESPGLTASLAIAEYTANLLKPLS